METDGLSEGPRCCHGNGCLAVPYPGPSISQPWWGSSGSQVHSLAIPEAYKHSLGYWNRPRGPGVSQTSFTSS